jgi:hypothetical protein
MNRNGNKAESFAGNFVAPNGWWQFFEVPYSKSSRYPLRIVFGPRGVPTTGMRCGRQLD